MPFSSRILATIAKNSNQNIIFSRKMPFIFSAENCRKSNKIVILTLAQEIFLVSDPLGTF
jgi:hypothetical protein